MANLSEIVQWEAGIYQLERTDPVDAGVGGAGVSNLQAKLLANRTAWLKRQVEKGFNFRGVVLNQATGSLGNSDYGYMYAWDETAVNGTYVIELPNIGAMDEQAAIGFTVGKTSGVSVEVAAFGTDVLYPFGTSEWTLNAGDTLVLVPRKNPLIGTHHWWPVVVPKSGIIQSIQSQLVPTGAIIAVAGNAAPTGYIPLNGAVVNRSSYPALWTYAQASGNLTVDDATWIANNWGAFSPGNGSTTFRVPDFRGEFLRGWDNGRGIDTGRTLGSFQDQAVNTAGVELREASTTWAANGAGVGSSVAYFENSNIVAYGTNMTLLGGTETRPRNLPVMYCIKF
jgi:microcystin-dependent protein